MIRKRPSEERGHANHGWLDTYHTFSFAGYYDPDHMGFRSLRVMNDDTVQPGAGFGTHSHNNMEIVSYVVDGALEHKDSMGIGSVLHPGDVQRMSAGTGVTHSEFNHSHSDPLRFLQIWVLPAKSGIEPSYEEKRFEEKDKRGRFRLIVSPDGQDDSLHIHQQVKIYASVLEPGNEIQHEVAGDRHAWIQVIHGRVELNGEELGRGDGAAVSHERRLNLLGLDAAEVLLFDLE